MTTTGDLARAQTAIEMHARELLRETGTIQQAAAALDRIKAAWDALDHDARVDMQNVAPGLVAAILRCP